MFKLKLLNYVENGIIKAGFADGSRVYALGEKSVDDVLKSDLLEWAKNNKEKIINEQKGVSIDSVKILTPVLHPEKIYCAAVNYASHSKEHKWEPPTEPYFFTKFQNALVADKEPIVIPRISSKVDWEVELAVIIGKSGKYIKKSEALDYVAGYTVANDISFRDLQYPKTQSKFGNNWVRGKGLDSALPLGPWLVTKDELVDPYASTISLSVNGIQRQHSKINEMIFKIDELIEYLSTGITLSPGDVISTGTPEGMANFTGVPFLKDGDVVEATIEGIGTLRNPVVAER